MAFESEEPGEAAAWPAAVELPAEIVESMVAHARSEYPNEACGIVVGAGSARDGGRALRFVATRNAAASPLRYEIDRGDLLRVTLETDDNDEAIWGIFHSHTHTEARPSATDTSLAFYPEAVYLLVSLDAAEADPETGAPSVRAWRIDGGVSAELTIRTTGAAQPSVEATQ